MIAFLFQNGVWRWNFFGCQCIKSLNISRCVIQCACNAIQIRSFPKAWVSQRLEQYFSDRHTKRKPPQDTSNNEPLSSIGSPTVIDDPQRTQPTTIRIDQVPRRIHEPHPALHPRITIQKPFDALDEIRRAPTRDTQLCDPQRSVSSRGIRLSDIALESRDVPSVAVPVDGHGIDRAAGALREERFEIGQSHGGTLPVCHGRCAEFHGPR